MFMYYVFCFVAADCAVQTEFVNHEFLLGFLSA